MLRQYAADFIWLLYPRACAYCQRPLARNEEVLCTFCLFTLPKTDYHLQRDNPLEKHFWGRVSLFRATAYCFFQRNGMLQKLIHQLKYKGRTDIGAYFGRIYGSELANHEDFGDITCIAPVPLHRSRLLQRGYNQTDFFCQGLSDALQKPWQAHLLVRHAATESQTRKNRFERWTNVASMFALGNTAGISLDHVLLADDIVTTGSTLEACAHVLLQAGARRVSVVTIGCAVE